MRFLKAIGIVFIICACLSAIAFAFALPSLERRAREEVIGQLKTKLDAKVELRVVKLSSIWPLGLRFQDLKIVPQNGLYRVEVGRLFIRYHYLTSLIDIDLEKPNIEWIGAPNSPERKTAPEPPMQVSSALPGGAVGGFLSTLGVEFFVREGIVRWQKDESTQISLQKLNIDITKSRILNEDEPIKAIIDSDLHYTTSLLSGQTTISARTNDMRASTSMITSQQAELAIGGLVLRANGVSNFAIPSHDWKVHADVEDLQKLPRPPDFLPAQNWKGKIALDASVHADKLDTKAEGSIKFKK